MREPFTHLYVHLVWSTWDRLPLIKPAVEKRLYGAMIKKCREVKCIPIRVGGIEDHTHLLVRLHSTAAVAKLVQEVKGSLSHLMTHEITHGEFFKWQGAYGAFTLRYEEVPIVKQYIINQRTHHGINTFRPEWEKSEINDEAELVWEELTDEEVIG